MQRNNCGTRHYHATTQSHHQTTAFVNRLSTWFWLSAGQLDESEMSTCLPVKFHRSVGFFIQSLNYELLAAGALAFKAKTIGFAIVQRTAAKWTYKAQRDALPLAASNHVNNAGYSNERGACHKNHQHCIVMQLIKLQDGDNICHHGQQQKYHPPIVIARESFAHSRKFWREGKFHGFANK
ncbi:MAG TPA: hypothetical protein VFC07_07450 [Verrucomicrobiae bacterium]|nr:hypothetical protein [Verrucomicrobiae bacterium]